VSAFFNAAKRAAVPNLARGAEEMLAANSLTASTTAATIAVGSALGGILATLAGREVVFLLNAATFLASAELIRRIRTRTERKSEVGSQHSAVSSRQWAVGEQPSSVETNLNQEASLKMETPADTQPTADGPLPSADSLFRRALEDFRGGLRYVRHEPVLRAIFVVAAGWGLGNGVARALYSIFGARLGEAEVAGWGVAARELIERPGEFGISVLFVAMGVGGVLGAPLARRFNNAGGRDLGARLGRSMAFDGCGLALFSLMPSLWVAALVLVAREVNFAVWWTAQQTILMRRADDAYAGRVFASYETLTTLMMVGSMLASGVAADSLGIRPVALAGGLVITCSGLLWFLLQPQAQVVGVRRGERN
ncbi:MAG TPA: MFS transporter, partial [Pyrinomonadaceae bacterium]